MLNSREDSVWRALAGAFHEGPAQTRVTYKSRDRKLLEMVLALGQRCLDAAAPSATASAAEDASPAALPPAGSPRVSLLRRAPFIASFFAVIFGLLLLHHL